MLHLPTNLRLQLTIDNAAEGTAVERTRLVLHKRAGESGAHVLMKLLGYLLFFHPELEVEVSAGQHYKPDLVRFDAEGEPVQWVDCGKISIRKLDRIARRNRRSRIDVIKPTPSELVSYQRAANGKVGEAQRVRIHAPDAGFLDDLAATLTDHAFVAATVSAERDHLELEVSGQTLETRIHGGTLD